jgi:hypothetical protein
MKATTRLFFLTNMVIWAARSCRLHHCPSTILVVGPVAPGNQPGGRTTFPIFPEIHFQLPKFILFEIQILPIQSQNLPKFMFYLFKIFFILCIVLKCVCLLVCMSCIEEPIFEEEPHLPDDPVDDVANHSEDKGKSHRPS